MRARDLLRANAERNGIDAVWEMVGGEGLEPPTLSV